MTSELALFLVSICGVPHQACNQNQAKMVQEQQIECFDELRNCVEKTKKHELPEVDRAIVCIKVRAKYGRVSTPSDEPREEYRAPKQNGRLIK